MLLAILLSGCVPTLVNYQSATGAITGTVVDPGGRPVAGARVTAIYYSPFTSLLPPAPNAMFAGETRTRPDGTFTLTTSDRVQELSVMSSRSGGMRGELRGVEQTENLIRMTPLPPLPPPHP